MLEELARQVKECRDAQKAYYKAVRNGVHGEDRNNLLIHAKTLEGRLDAAVENILNPKTDLFSGE